ncbi:hypothetical protein [Nocardia jinanensis]|uniref:Uncharacterized protein n=1 Tax=Nocardia jinanensis TaxID=382504 RepID=A0A917R600_9NOCA|nr:hypothetical protein [Nocardia jinanensis]GGK91603.1 hypothetical protein GCM10011588_02470 [Nocardia jinanensis]
MATPGPTCPRLRGVFAGAAAGVVSIAAHAFGGGALAPGTSTVALLLAGCAITGALATATRPGRGPMPLMALLALGQAIGHTALVTAPGHHHGALSTATMLMAHLLAIPVGALLIHTAERAVRYAVSRLKRTLRRAGCREISFRRTVIVPAGEHRPARLLLLSSGPGTRGPPPPRV